jgi:hypothetical protein
MPTPRRAAKLHNAEKTHGMGPNSRIRPPSGSQPKLPTQTAVAAGKRTGSTLSNDESRNKVSKVPHAATGIAKTPHSATRIASTPPEVVRLSQEGLSPSNRTSNTPVPAAPR